MEGEESSGLRQSPKKGNRAKEGVESSGLDSLQRREEWSKSGSEEDSKVVG